MNNNQFQLDGKRVLVTGQRGLVGAACLKRLSKDNCIIIPEPNRSVLDYIKADQVDAFIADMKPDLIIMCAARVGGLVDNDTYPENSK